MESARLAARRLAFAGATVLAWTATSGTALAASSCDAIARTADDEQAHVRPAQAMRVTGEGRLHFHAAPDTACATRTFVIPKDSLLAYSEWHGWFFVQYTNARTGKVSSGWIPPGRTEITGSIGPGDEAPAISSRHANLPKPVAQLVERAQNCAHFAGEFNGDQSAHDREVNRVMTELRCDTVERDVAAARKRYAKDVNALAALDALEQDERAEGRCRTGGAIVGDGPFVVGRRYRVLQSFTAMRDSFVKGDELVYESSAWSRYDGITGYFFRNQANGSMQWWDVYDHEPLSQWTELFEPLDSASKP